MDDKLDAIIQAVSDALSQAMKGVGEDFANSIFSAMIKWFYDAIYGAVSDVITDVNDMGTKIFDLPWVSAMVLLFSYLGWILFAVGSVVAVFDVAIEYQNGGGNIKGTALNVLKAFFAVSLIPDLPIELYKFSVSLQNTFSHALAGLIGAEASSLSSAAEGALEAFTSPTETTLLVLLQLIVFVVCLFNLFFQNIKRGGILLIQICVGSLHMFSLPRGYDEGFTMWAKQVLAVCVTAFIQTTMMYLGLITFKDQMLLGVGIMLAACDVPRIAQAFGIDTSMKFSVMSAARTTAGVVSKIATVL